MSSDRMVFVDRRWVVELEQTAPAIATSGDYCGAEFRGYPNYVGEWGDDLDLQLQSNAIDDFMTLQFYLPNSGCWDIHMAYTRFKYAADFSIDFQGSGYGPTWQGYSPDYRHSGLVLLGNQCLSQQSSVTFRVVGRDPRSQNYWIGIDRLEFTPSIPPADSVINDLTISIIQEGVVLTWSPIMIDSSGYWVQSSQYDVHRLAVPGDSLSSANLLATCCDTTFLDTTALEVLHHAFYQVAGRCGDPRGYLQANNQPLATPAAIETRIRSSMLRPPPAGSNPQRTYGAPPAGSPSQNYIDSEKKHTD